jgi:hypothetical protein
MTFSLKLGYYHTTQQTLERNFRLVGPPFLDILLGPYGLNKNPIIMCVLLRPLMEPKRRKRRR